MLTIERTEKEIIIRLPLDMAIDDIQRMLDYLSYKRALAGSKATPEQIGELAREVKKGWWAKNKKRFPGLIEE